ncbi:cell division cycle-associated 7-like protein [Aplochiton taeniatus]
MYKWYKTPRALVDIFESLTDDEDFTGFGVTATDASEDSRDSLYSRPCEKPALCFKSKFINSELVDLFSQSDSEREEFEGFCDEQENRSSKRIKTALLRQEAESEEESDTGFYSDGEEPAGPGRKSLCVAFRFPIKRLSTQKPEVPEKKVKKTPVPAALPETRPLRMTRQKSNQTQPKVSTLRQQVLSEKTAPKTRQQRSAKTTQQESTKPAPEEQEEDTGMQREGIHAEAMSKRDKNIQENKAMLAKLFADLSTMDELTSLTTPKRKKRVSEKPSPRGRGAALEAGSERRNPSRKARPPENFGVEKRESPTRVARAGPRAVDVRRLVEVDEDLCGRKGGKGKTRGRRVSMVRPVDDITQEELDNIAERAKDKIWDKENGSSCHQCRQKTLDTKTVCRSGFCVGVKGQFCAPCLKNRYGEDVRSVLLDPTWWCPLCRGVCNCSLCRKREGRCATGILVGLARYNGHDNVHEYLESIQKGLD